MPTPFLSSEEYDERAHALYNEGKYDEALTLLREAVARYPNAVELYVGFGYARLAREEYAWARRSFDEALVLDPDHEDALAGLGEVLLKFGQVDAALRAFEQTVTLGYDDDVDLMLQIGRALFREGFVDTALAYFDRAAGHAADSAEAAACVGYAQHRMGRDADAVETLTRALALDPQLVEARVYLANLMYDVGDLDAALVEFEKTKPEDHWDELGIWRVIELKKSVYELDESDGELKPWEARLVELADENDAIDDLLEEVEQSMMEQDAEAMPEAQGQLEALGSLLTGLVNQHHGEQAEPAFTDVLAAETSHRVIMRDGSVFEGTWEEIVRALRDARDAGRPLDEYMAAEARRFYGATGKQVASDAPEAFLRGGADAGMLRIDR
jgi:Tfp pilus assembly protein PilF